MDRPAIYRRSRARIVDFATSLEEAELNLPVAACPEWRVRDVIAHLAGVAVDAVAGNFAGAGGDEWTARQVAERRGRPLDVVLAEWAEVAPTLESELPFPQLAFDIACHEWDLRGATARPGDKSDDDIDAFVQEMAGWIDARLVKRGLPLRVVAGVDEFLLGGASADPSAVASLRLKPFELFRMGFGRRSRAQMTAYDWEGDPEPFLDLLTVFPPPAEDLSEPG